jgi:hypothetical protein
VLVLACSDDGPVAPPPPPELESVSGDWAGTVTTSLVTPDNHCVARELNRGTGNAGVLVRMLQEGAQWSASIDNAHVSSCDYEGRLSGGELKAKARSCGDQGLFYYEFTTVRCSTGDAYYLWDWAGSLEGSFSPNSRRFEGVERLRTTWEPYPTTPGAPVSFSFSTSLELTKQ